MEIPAEYEKSSVAALLSPLLVTRGALRAAKQSDLFAIVSSQSPAKYLMGTFLLRHCAMHCNRRLRQAAAGKLLMPSGYSLPTMTQQPGAQTATALSASLATSGSQLNLHRQTRRPNRGDLITFQCIGTSMSWTTTIAEAGFETKAKR